MKLKEFIGITTMETNLTIFDNDVNIIIDNKKIKNITLEEYFKVKEGEIKCFYLNDYTPSICIRTDIKLTELEKKKETPEDTLKKYEGYPVDSNGEIIDEKYLENKKLDDDFKKMADDDDF